MTRWSIMRALLRTLFLALGCAATVVPAWAKKHRDEPTIGQSGRYRCGPQLVVEVLYSGTGDVLLGIGKSEIALQLSQGDRAFYLGSGWTWRVIDRQAGELGRPGKPATLRCALI